jgi:hypothetical protein
MHGKLPVLSLSSAAALFAFVSMAVADDIGKTTEGVWDLTQTTSQVDDSPEVTAVNVAPGAGTVLLSNKPGAIGIRCKDQRTDLVVQTTGFLGIGIGGDGMKVIYRIDSQPAVTKQWQLSANGNSVFYPGSPITFIRSLPPDGHLFIRLYDSQGSYEETTFSLEGLDAVRDAVATACKWPPPKN